MFAMFASAYETGSKTLVADQSKVMGPVRSFGSTLAIAYDMASCVLIVCAGFTRELTAFGRCLDETPSRRLTP